MFLQYFQGRQIFGNGVTILMKIGNGQVLKSGSAVGMLAHWRELWKWRLESENGR